jgi:hypothetical protein
MRVQVATGEIQEIREYGASILCMVFAFEAETALLTLTDNLVEIASSVDHACILGAGNITWIGPEKPVEGGLLSVRTKRHDDPKDGISVQTPKSEANRGFPLFFFLSELHDHVQRESNKRRRFAPLNYLKWPEAGRQVEWRYPNGQADESGTNDT